MVIALAAIWIFFASQSGNFLSARNLSMLAVELAITATLALGMLLVLLPGHIDLSVGSGVGLIGGIAAVLIFQYAWPAPLALLAGLIVALVLWALMSTLIVRQRVPSFIITLGGLLVFKGLFWLIIQNSTVPVARGSEGNLYSLLTTYSLPQWAGFLVGTFICGILVLTWIRDRAARRRHGFPVEDAEISFLKTFLIIQGILLVLIVLNSFRGVPLCLLVLVVIAVLIHLLTRHTPFGRHLYAIGGNEEAAHLAGIPVARVITTAYILLGAVVALTGFMQTSYQGAATTTVGELMELDAIAACVIGGTSLRGGRGTVTGVLFGALIMASLLNGMTLLAVPPEMKLIARGTVLVLAVWLDTALNRHKIFR